MSGTGNVVAVFGAAGQVGQALLRRAAGRGLRLSPFDRAQADITDEAAVRKALQSARPSVVINLAAYTNVDAAEGDEAAALAINRDGAGSLARAAEQIGAAVIHVSTDYVFDGTKRSPYLPDDRVAPLGVYGRSKAAGEEAVRTACSRAVIVRTAWVYGNEGRNFVKTMLRLAEQRRAIHVVDDQHGSPTFADDLADGLLDIAMRIGQNGARTGTYHLTGGGQTTWCGFARAVFDVSAQRGLPVPEVHAISTADYPTPARRPAYSVLDCASASQDFAVVLPHWTDGLSRMLTHELEGTATAHEDSR